MNIPALGLAAVVTATSTISVIVVLVLSEHRVARQQSVLVEAGAETKRAQRRLSALQQDLDRERAGNQRLRDQIASLERDVLELRTLTALDQDQAETTTQSDDAVIAREKVPAPLRIAEPTPWQRFRSGDTPSDASFGKSDLDDSRVATVSSILGLGADQEAFYAELLSDYGARVDELYDRVAEGYDFAAAADPFLLQEMLAEIQEEKATLDAMLDEEFSRTLSDEQSSRYLALPDDERGLGPDAGIDRLELQILDLPFILSDMSRANTPL